jgi:hypothetical protein
MSAPSFTLDWQDGQPNVFAAVECDQYAIDNGIRYDVAYDYIGRSWFGYCDLRYYGPPVLTRDECKRAIERHLIRDDRDGVDA